MVEETAIKLGLEHTVVVGVIAYFVGRQLTRHIGILDKFRIPEAVTGGLVVALLVTMVRSFFDVEISFTAGELLLLAFFTTIGLNARIPDLLNGGKPLVILLILASVTVALQSTVGIAMANILGMSTADGLMLGSVSLVGGHGTAAAWGPQFEALGQSDSTAIGIAAATFGLIAGGLIGAPVGRALITRRRLQPSDAVEYDIGLPETKAGEKTIESASFFFCVLLIAAGIGIGDQLNAVLTSLGVNFPRFVTALFAGIVIANTVPRLLPKIEWPMHSPSMALIADLSLNLFLVRALMSLQLWTLADAAGPILILLITQMVIIALVGYFIVFRLMGGRYDAAIITSGYIGLSLGATPTAVANMASLTKRFGHSHQAFLIVPLVGAFFIDIVNAFVIQTATALFM